MSDPLSGLRRRLARRHHLVGWCGLLAFLSLGIALEALHGFKAGFYLDPAHRWRREMWRPAHPHRTLLSLVHGAFAPGLGRFCPSRGRPLNPRPIFLSDAP